MTVNLSPSFLAATTESPKGQNGARHRLISGPYITPSSMIATAVIVLSVILPIYLMSYAPVMAPIVGFGLAGLLQARCNR
jgi:hypothetical protein